eukprot:8483387-Alexandrium_andersonii.AAC.1
MNFCCCAVALHAHLLVHSSQLVAKPLKRLEENGLHACCGSPPSLGAELHHCLDAYPREATGQAHEQDRKRDSTG